MVLKASIFAYVCGYSYAVASHFLAWWVIRIIIISARLLSIYTDNKLHLLYPRSMQLAFPLKCSMNAALAVQDPKQEHPAQKFCAAGGLSRVPSYPGPPIAYVFPLTTFVVIPLLYPDSSIIAPSFSALLRCISSAFECSWVLRAAGSKSTKKVRT